MLTFHIGSESDFEIDILIVNHHALFLLDGNDEGFFAIHNETGSISVVKELKKVGYKIEVAATDGGSPANEAKVIVVVNVDGSTYSSEFIATTVCTVNIQDKAQHATQHKSCMCKGDSLLC